MSDFADRIMAQLDPGDLKRARATLGSCIDEPFIRIDMMNKAYGFSVHDMPSGYEYRFKKYKDDTCPMIVREAEGRRPLRPEIAFRQVVRAITGEFGGSVERLKKEWSE